MGYDNDIYNWGKGRTDVWLLKIGMVQEKKHLSEECVLGSRGTWPGFPKWKPSLVFDIMLPLLIKNRIREQHMRKSKEMLYESQRPLRVLVPPKLIQKP